ncbi:3',5'-cyclic-AMP phosphodiesterase [Agitococcus lubricus]|uniref:Icc protein n=1 Tax=Agitococcus lubricus TaxID=1077255 RepID=A0A2T5J0S9_9GAMM|nr:3',5'-cyclic-AMP phosphodiesterase [Agitococcus lubricus]PTQ89998.1 Icc protein [Agitococcus lubricus]
MKKHKQPPLRVVQVSDSHLFANTEGRLLGLNTEDSLRLVLEKVKREQSHIDVILATGDIAQDASEQAYTRFQQHLAQFNTPNYWLQGNHDITQPILNILGNNKSHLSPCVIQYEHWCIIMLNSSVEYEVPGKFKPEELEFLKQALEQSKDYHVMVCLHHHPVPMGCKWLDTQVVRNANDFWQVIDQFSHIKAIVWGHVHQESDRMRQNVRLLSAPSTCVQFKPLSSDFAVDDIAPGYRWFDLYADGKIETAVSRVEGVKFVVDWTVKGY